MKLHRLVLRGLGPFAEAEEIDFAALGQGGLFLIEGPTGSGKSTIIDAVVFALYGSPAGEGAGKERLVSHFVNLASITPEVELTFELSGGRFYRVVRSPAFMRPGKRGTGDTRQGAKARLYALDADELAAPTAELRADAIASQVPEVGQLLKDAIGLERNQFTQTMVLPQGQFTTFLQASARDRKELLERLFDTGLYSRIEAEFERRRREVSTESDALAESAALIVARVAEAAAMSPDTVAHLTTLAKALRDQSGDAQSIYDVIDARQHELDDLAAKSASQRTECDSAHRRQQDERQRLDSLAKRVEQRRKVDLRRAALTDSESEAAAIQSAIMDLENAVLPLERQRTLLERQREETDAMQRLDRLTASHPDLRDSTEDDVRDLVRELTDQMVALGSAVEGEESLPEATRLAADLDRAAEVAQAQVGVAATQREQYQGEHDELQRERDGLAIDAARVEAATNLLTGVEQRLKAARDAVAAGNQVTQHEAAAAEAMRRHSEASQTLLTLSAQYRSAAAAMLAGELQASEPCPVCGSCDHPQPASPTGDDAVTSEQVDSAAKVEHMARKAYDKAMEVVTESKGQRDRLLDQAKGSISELQATVESAERGATTAKQAFDRVSQIDVERGALAQRIAELPDPAMLAAAAATARTLATAANTELATLRELVANARGGFNSVALRVQSLSDARQTLSALADAKRDLVEVRRLVATAQADFAAALQASGFASPDDLKHVQSLGDPAILKAKRDQRLQEEGTVAELLASLQDVDPAEEVDMAAADLALHDAASKLGEAQKEYARTSSAASTTRERTAELRHAVADLDRARSANAGLIALANLISGQSRDMSLALFAVRRRFEEVVAVANERLSSMLDGRLTLVAHDDPADGRQSRGLALHVVDRFTGMAREASSVSGGEGFCCALALALALAEVVASEQGQVSTGTLFIDEGFGSLDSEALEEVIGVLDALRSGGRMVGVVSHVTEMKVQIRQQIQVRRGDGGRSSITVVLP